ncbi:hypothetical protein M758_N027800 [Ceratodon purpureus]|nr:hypothetical protein M758_N027800 [Ceratodon purpureus]
MTCPCKLCDRGYRQEKYVDTVLHHLDPQKMFGRDPKHYGSSMGYDLDESDEEWDNHIVHSYGALATLPPSERQSVPAEDDYDISEFCHRSTYMTISAGSHSQMWKPMELREPDMQRTMFRYIQTREKAVLHEQKQIGEKVHFQNRRSLQWISKITRTRRGQIEITRIQRDVTVLYLVHPLTTETHQAFLAQTERDVLITKMPKTTNQTRRTAQIGMRIHK